MSVSVALQTYSLHRTFDFVVFSRGRETLMAREVGFLVAAKQSDWDQYIDWFKARLTTPNVNITFLPPGGAAGDPVKISETAKYFAGNCEVIVTSGTQAALACKAETQTNQTPFVF